MCGCLKREKDIRSTLGTRTRRVLRTIQICRSRLVIIIHQIRVVVLHTIVHNSYHDSCTRDPSIPYCIYFDVMSRVLCISLCTTCHTRRQHQSCASAKVLITRSSKETYSVLAQGKNHCSKLTRCHWFGKAGSLNSNRRRFRDTTVCCSAHDTRGCLLNSVA